MGWTFGSVLWSEVLSCQLEYKYLAHLTGRRQYFDNASFPFDSSMMVFHSPLIAQVEKIMDIMRDANVTDGMFPTRWNLGDAKPSNGMSRGSNFRPVLRTMNVSSILCWRFCG